MRIIALRTLREFWQTHPDAEQPLRTWYAKTKRATWTTPTDVKTAQRNVSLIGNHRAVFNIKGNDYRLVVALDYEYGVVYIRFIGTHRAYDQIEATTI
jgi:mRNA interferase HigB